MSKIRTIAKVHDTSYEYLTVDQHDLLGQALYLWYRLVGYTMRVPKNSERCKMMTRRIQRRLVVALNKKHPNATNLIGWDMVATNKMQNVIPTVFTIQYTVQDRSKMDGE